MNAATQNELERLRDTVADLRTRLAQMELERDAALEREAALAAGIKHIRSVWNHSDNLFSDEWINRVGKALDDADEKTNSLEKRDLTKQAEALEYAAKHIVKWTQCEILMSHANGYRQRASEL